jgi:cell division septum initiation protein DivIVA
MSDIGMKGRMKGLLGGVPPIDGPAEPTEVSPDSKAQQQALQVLTLAQRTAEEHVADAHHQADKISADARATAEQIVREAKAHATDLQREADKALADARMTAEQIARDAQAVANDVRRNADETLRNAQARAEEIAKEARTNADELKQQAEQRYQDVVGSLAAKREALQQQIEALEEFDQDYRARLTAFMQTQLRALWVDEPQVDATEIENPAASATGSLSAHNSHSRR